MLAPDSNSPLGWLLTAPSDEAFLDEAYQTLLGRAPDGVGLTNYQRALDRGGSRLLVLYMLRYSAEGQARDGTRSRRFQLHRLLQLARQPMTLRRAVGYLKRGGSLSGLLRKLTSPASSNALPQTQTTVTAGISTTVFKPAPWLWLYRLSPVKRPLSPLLLYSERRYLRRHPELFARRVFLELSRQIELQQLALEEAAGRVAKTKKALSNTQEALNQEIQRRERLAKDLDFFRSDLIHHRTQTQELMASLRALSERSANEPAMPASTTSLQPHLKTALAAADDHRLNAFYVAFEEEFRGSLEQIRTTQAGYLADLRAAAVGMPAAPVLDLGCGRGEWLELLTENGITASGIDANPVMVARCRERHLDSRLGDVLTELRGLPDGALGALTAFHLIEHLPFALLHDLMQQAHRVLIPGGLLILETPNPENLLVGSHTFYHDPTHRNPLTPNATRFLVRYSGFCDPTVRRIHPYPESARVPGSDPLSERVNGHLCGPQDFAIIAQKPLDPAHASGGADHLNRTPNDSAEAASPLQ